ncbi:MAG: hypothetical protein WC292_01940 [Clostridia bacterium]
MISDRLAQKESIMNLKKEIFSGKLSHAYLLFVPDTYIREPIEKLISSAILCPQGGCGECAVCTKIYTDSHADIAVYNKDGKYTVKEAKENFIPHTYVKGWESEKKLYFFYNAESLSTRVQNTILKILEEPPQNVIIFLISGGEGGLLSTVLSRLKKADMPTFNSVEIAEELISEGVSPALAETAAVFSGGRFDRAFKYADEKEYSEIYERTFQVLDECRKSSQIAEYINDKIFSKENIAVTLEFFEIILRDVLGLAAGNTDFITINKAYLLGRIADGFSSGGAAMAVLAVTNAKKMLSSNIAPVTAAETLLFDILEAKYKWH